MVVILLLSALIWRQMQPIDAMLHTRLIAEIAPYRQADPQIVLVNLDDSTQWSPAPIWHSPDQNLMATEILLEIAAANAKYSQ